MTNVSNIKISADSCSFLNEEYVNQNEYKKWRDAQINLSERQGWPADPDFQIPFSTLDSKSFWKAFKISIRRGVPDTLKRSVWVKSNGTCESLIETPNLYEATKLAAFGTYLPEQVTGRVPTFSGGILGLHEDKTGIRIPIENDTDDTIKSTHSSYTKRMPISLSSTDLLQQWLMTSGNPSFENESSSGQSCTPNDTIKSKISKSFLSPKNLFFKKPEVKKQLKTFRTISDPQEGSSSIRKFEINTATEPDVVETDFRAYMIATHARNKQTALVMNLSRRKSRERTWNEGLVRHDTEEMIRSSSASALTPVVPTGVKKKISQTIPRITSCPPYKMNYYSKTQNINSKSQHTVAPDLLSRFSSSDQNANSFVKSKQKYKSLKELGKRIAQFFRIPCNNAISEPPVPQLQPNADATSISGITALSPSPFFGNQPNPPKFIEVEDVRQTSTSSEMLETASCMSLDLLLGNANEDDPSETSSVVYMSEVSSVHLNKSKDGSEVSSAQDYSTCINRLELVTDLFLLLTPDGVDCVKRILWCLHSSHSMNPFCPVIPPLCCVLILYLSESEAFTTLHHFILRARNWTSKDPYQKHPFMFGRRREFIRFVNVILKGIEKHHSKLHNHFNQMNVDIAAWIARAIQDGFSSLLPFNYVLRIFGALLFEGVKTLFRYCLAILKIIQRDLLHCKSRNAIEIMLYDISSNSLIDLEKLTKMAYSFDLKWHTKRYKTASEVEPTSYLMEVDRVHLCRPRLNEKSEILSEKDWDFLWTSLPDLYQILDPVLVFQTPSSGMSILTATVKLHDTRHRPMLMLMLTTQQEIFGFSCPFSLQFNSKFLKGHYYSRSCVYTLRPLQQIYWWTGSQTVLMDCEKTSICIGSQDVAIYINESLENGISQPSLSFNSPVLVNVPDGTFTIARTEIWQLC